jgi:hypothetical protein
MKKGSEKASDLGENNSLIPIMSKIHLCHRSLLQVLLQVLLKETFKLAFFHRAMAHIHGKRLNGTD